MFHPLKTNLYPLLYQTMFSIYYLLYLIIPFYPLHFSTLFQSFSIQVKDSPIQLFSQAFTLPNLMELWQNLLLSLLHLFLESNED